MSYVKKYFGYFGDMDGVQHTVEFWELNGTAGSSELRLTMQPFTVSMPETEHKFQPVLGTGCTINILSETDQQFSDGFIFVDPQKWLIKHYIAAAINWVGFLNAELFEEPYDINFNYPVQMSGNDGFALMDRFSFLQADATHYTGIKSLWQILTLILAKVNLPFSAIRVALSTTFTGFSAAASKNILEEQYVDCANFYDEDNAAFTMRKVLEGILQPFGYITQQGGILYIIDNHLKATGGTINWKSYELSAGVWSYITTIADTANTKTVLSVGYMGTGSRKVVSGGKNKQVVSYSPYPMIGGLAGGVDNTIASPDGLSEFTTIPGSWSTKNGYSYKVLSGNTYWLQAGGGFFEIAKDRFDPLINYATYAALLANGGNQGMQENTTYTTTETAPIAFRWDSKNAKYNSFDSSLIVYGSPENIHFVSPYNATNTKVLSLIDQKEVVFPKSLTVGTGTSSILMNGVGITIKGQIGVIAYRNRARNFSANPYGKTYPHNIFITMKIKIGSYYYSGLGSGGDWTETDSFCTFKISKVPGDGDVLSGDFYTLEKNYDTYNLLSSRDDGLIEMIYLGEDGADNIFIPITKDLSGTLSIELWSDIRCDVWNKYSVRWHTLVNSNLSQIKAYWLNNVSISIKREDGADISNNDVEYIGLLDNAYKEEGKKVELICGTNAKTTDRGKLMKLSGTTYTPIATWTRQGQTDKIETLLLNSLCSNYKKGFVTLNGMVLRSTINQLNIITDTFSSGKLFAIKGIDVNYQDNIATCTLEEVMPDHLIITPNV